MRLVIFCLSLLFALPAVAAESDARAVALQNACKPTKIEVTTQSVGSMGETAYKVTCESKAPASGSGAQATPKTITVRCRGHMCVAAN